MKRYRNNLTNSKCVVFRNKKIRLAYPTRLGAYHIVFRLDTNSLINISFYCTGKDDIKTMYLSRQRNMFEEPIDTDTWISDIDDKHCITHKTLRKLITLLGLDVYTELEKFLRLPKDSIYRVSFINPEYPNL